MILVILDKRLKVSVIEYSYNGKNTKHTTFNAGFILSHRTLYYSIEMKQI